MKGSANNANIRNNRKMAERFGRENSCTENTDFLCVRFKWKNSG